MSYGPYSTVNYTGNGVTNQFALPFSYVSQSDITVLVNGISAAFTWANSTTIQTTLTPPNGATVFISRQTNLTNPSVTFADGSTLRAADLNAEFTQTIYGIQEAWDQTAAYINLARTQTGQLPVVLNTDVNKVLVVTSAGAWTYTYAPVADASLVSTASGLSVQLQANGGLTLTGGTGLATLMDPNGGLTNGASGQKIKVNGATGITLSASGVALSFADTSITGGAGGLAVGLNTTGGLQTSSGLAVKIADTSLSSGASGIQINLNGSGGLQTSTGLKVLARDTSMTIGGSGIGVNVVATGGLSISGGILVKGVNVVSSDPGSPADGDVWYNSTNKSLRTQEAGIFTANIGCPFKRTSDGGPFCANSTALVAGTNVNFPANFWTAGKQLRVRLYLQSVIVGTNTTTLIGLYRDGTTAAFDSFTITTNIGTTRYSIEYTVTCRTTGASGQFQVSGCSNTETNLSQLTASGTTVSMDTTLAHTLGFAYQLGVANASNGVTEKNITYEILDP